MVLTVAPQLVDAASPKIWLMLVVDCVPPKVTVKLPLLPVTLTLSMPTNASRADLRPAAVIDVASAVEISPLWATRQVPLVALLRLIVWISGYAPPSAVVFAKLEMLPPIIGTRLDVLIVVCVRFVPLLPLRKFRAIVRETLLGEVTVTSTFPARFQHVSSTDR